MNHKKQRLVLYWPPLYCLQGPLSALQQPEEAISGMIMAVQNYTQKRIWMKPWM